MPDHTDPITQVHPEVRVLRGTLIRCVRGPDIGREWSIQSDLVRIGHGPRNDVRLSDDSVSRRHAVIVCRGDRVVLRDLDSTNGTVLNGVGIKEVFLPPNTPFVLGETTLECIPTADPIDPDPSMETKLCGLVGQSESMRVLFSLIERVAPTRVSLLIQGETGTGKELAARSIHQMGPCPNGPLVFLDCGNLNPNMAMSDILGHTRGAFTGATSARDGVFVQADGGTLVLDEVALLPHKLQAALLRVAELGQLAPLGATEMRHVDVRLISTSNHPLHQAVTVGDFRADLYFRLAGVEVNLPTLRSRIDDLPLLIPHLLHRIQGESPEVGTVSPEVLAVLTAWRWPGNVRELDNTLRRALAFTDGERIGLGALTPAMRADVQPSTFEEELPFAEIKTILVRAFERRYLTELMVRFHNNVTRAAKGAGIERRSLLRLLKKHDLR